MVKRALINVVHGSPTDHAITRTNHQRYAAKIGCDYVVVRTEKLPRPPVKLIDTENAFDHDCFFKFAVNQATAKYDQSLYLDGDCVVTRDCPNIFDFVPVGKYGFVDELTYMRPAHVNVIKYWFQCVGGHNTWWSLNGGVLVLPRTSEKFYSYKPELDFQYANDQHMLSISIRPHAEEYLLLDSRFNHSYMHHTDFYAGLPNAWIVHLAGMGGYQTPAERDAKLVRCIENFGV